MTLQVFHHALTDGVHHFHGGKEVGIALHQVPWHVPITIGGDEKHALLRVRQQREQKRPERLYRYVVQAAIQFPLVELGHVLCLEADESWPPCPRPLLIGQHTERARAQIAQERGQVCMGCPSWALVGTDASLAQIALRFCLSHPAITTVVTGVQNMQQVTCILAAIEQGPLPQEVSLPASQTLLASGNASASHLVLGLVV